VSPSALIESKTREIALRLRSLTDEFEYWRGRSAQSNPLEKHDSQIRSVTSQLEGLRDRLAGSLQAESTAGVTPLAAGQRVERDLLELFRIWEFFRAKFAQREITRLRNYLDAADELAWACYEPPRRAAHEAGRVTELALREPPLVFLNGGASPFAYPRFSSYDAEPVPGETLAPEVFRGVLRSLPIPLVGVPWFQASHLPDVLVIAHEVGHHVEDDLGLTATLTSRLQGCIQEPTRRANWLGWMGEAFADVFGTVALGSAFALTMMDLLAAETSHIAKEVSRAAAGDAYPTVYLRVLLILEVVRRRAGEATAQALRSRWNETYGASHAMSEYEVDLAAVVEAFAFTPFDELGGKTIAALLPFAPATEELAQALARAAPTRDELTNANARVLFAAIRHVFDGAASSASNGIERLRVHLIDTRAPGVRSRARSDVEQAIVDQRDRTRGSALVEKFAQLRRP
jgi:hypothetical protein